MVSIDSFFSESGDLQYLQLSDELPSAKLQEFTKTIEKQAFGPPVLGGIVYVREGRRDRWAGGGTYI